ncbi:MAG: nicotinamide-nucleotide amidohydrolase family protein [Oscillospiraceae bacterium]|nr:nicotinamide-nucleotide amidohydrolase family protein [Oscillospiraceae bacterium]
MKIIEWNLNHRIGFFKQEMPTWVQDVITEKDADIVVLTETSFRVPNWSYLARRTFGSDYYVFHSQNALLDQNDITIAVRKSRFSVLNSSSFPSGIDGAPDHLEVRCMERETNTDLTIVGMRIHNWIEPKERKKEAKKVLDSVCDRENVIVAGDFNNYRRGFAFEAWNLNVLTSIFQKRGYRVITPRGGSIFYDNDGEYSFPEDHVMLKGLFCRVKEYPYDREFVYRDSASYPWGKNFEHYCGQDADGKNQYEHLALPVPDHAIIEVDFEIGDSIETLVSQLKSQEKTVATAESCTGGLLGKSITDISGSSAVYPGGVITYCNRIKHELLGVDQALLDSLGPVSEPVARQMAEGVRRVIGTDLGIGITGIAGPNSDDTGKPVGLVYLAASDGETTLVRECHFDGDRNAVRSMAAEAAADLALELIGKKKVHSTHRGGT